MTALLLRSQLAFKQPQCTQGPGQLLLFHLAREQVQPVGLTARPCHHAAGEQAQPVGPTAQPWLCCHGAQPAGPEVTDEERWYPPVTENLFGYLKSPSNQTARPHLWCQGAGPVCQPHSLAMAPAASRTPSRAATGCTNASTNTVIFHS